MDQPALLSGDELAAGLRLIARVSETYPVEVAFWMGGVDPVRYNLYLASSDFTSKNRISVRHDVGLMARELDSIFLDPWSIRVVGMDEPVTRWAIELRRDHNGIAHSWQNSVQYQGKFVGPMYVYSERNLASFALI